VEAVFLLREDLVAKAAVPFQKLAHGFQCSGSRTGE
jgi:hypothetical protein